MSKITDRFTSEHFALQSISPQRQKQVVAALARYEEHLSIPIEQATDAHLRGWLVELLREGRQPSTVLWYLRMITPFYRWCWERELIEGEHFMRVSNVAPPRGSSQGVPRPYSQKELELFWNQLDEHWPLLARDGIDAKRLARWYRGTLGFRMVKKHAMRTQLNAMIELALVCGLRRNEILHLSIEDCHWDNEYIVVHGKRVDQRPKVRDVPYPESTREAIKAWYRIRTVMGPEHESLWLSVTGPDPLAPLAAHRMRMVMLSFGDWQFHRLRHTCATERLRAGMKIEQLQLFLGHASIEQTLRYAKLARGDIHRESERIDADFQRRVKRDAA